MEYIDITVYSNQVKKPQNDLFGIFFEDINHAADGGLYGELVRNRSFEFNEVDRPGYHELTAWKTVERGGSLARAHVETKRPLNTENLHYLVLEIITAGEGGGILNEGYDQGIPIVADNEYTFSCWYHLLSDAEGEIEIRLEDKAGSVCYNKVCFIPEKGDWKQYECILKSQCPDDSARLVILSKTPVRIALDMISMFPLHTFMDRKNGLRADIAEMICDMKPKFMRFPGGCLAHIGSLDMEDRCSMYRWKKTLGPVEKRPARRNSWNYNQTLGLGFYEYFLFCEDIGAEPLPVIAAGYDPHSLRIAPLDQMQEWVDEALDLIEFANGTTDTKWGAMRAEMGHPESFHLKYLAIGNEEVGDAFFERYGIILQAVKKMHPEIEVINSAGAGCAGNVFEKGWEQARRTPTSYVDEHFYQCPEWFLANADRYQDYPPEPKAFIGEYASKNDLWKNALAEAAFMTGLEKAEGVGLACYAPLLCNAAYKNWHPNLICFDNHRVFGTPSYYVQKLFMNYQGEYLLESSDNLKVRTPPKISLSGQIGIVTRNANVDITEFSFLNNETGREVKIPDFNISEEVKRHDCLDTASSYYQVTFRYCKRNGGLSQDLEGRNSFGLEFARRDEKNKLVWTIDGWQRLTSVNGVCDGYEADMGLYEFESVRNQIHEAKLLVEGNRIRTYLDGKLYCDHVCKNPVPEVLYYSAVKDQDDTVIVKLVNPEDQVKTINIHVDAPENVFGEEIFISLMAGFSLDERNSFEEPKRVAPAESVDKWNGKIFTYSLPEHSLAVLRFPVNAAKQSENGCAQ